MAMLRLTPGGGLEIMWDVRVRRKVFCMQIKHPTCCTNSPALTNGLFNNNNNNSDEVNS